MTTIDEEKSISSASTITHEVSDTPTSETLIAETSFHNNNHVDTPPVIVREEPSARHYVVATLSLIVLIPMFFAFLTIYIYLISAGARLLAWQWEFSSSWSLVCLGGVIAVLTAAKIVEFLKENQESDFNGWEKAAACCCDGYWVAGCGCALCDRGFYDACCCVEMVYCSSLAVV